MAIGLGAMLDYETTPGGGTYTNITEVKTISGPSIEVGEVEKTHLASSNAAKEYESGLIEPGEIEAEIYWNKTVLNTLYGLIRTTRLWRIRYPDSPASTWISSGFIKALGSEGYEVEEELMTMLTIKLTGKPTYTAG